MQSNKFVNELLEWSVEYQIEDILNICQSESPYNREVLQNLKSLDVSFKKLNSLPTHIFELSSLENLNLSHNNLQELPKEIIKLKSLKTLDISWNHITHNLDFLSTEIKVNCAWNR